MCCEIAFPKDHGNLNLLLIFKCHKIFSRSIELGIKNPEFQSWLGRMRLGKYFWNVEFTFGLTYSDVAEYVLRSLPNPFKPRSFMVMCRPAVLRCVHFFFQVNSLGNSNSRKVVQCCLVAESTALESPYPPHTVQDRIKPLVTWSPGELLLKLWHHPCPFFSIQVSAFFGQMELVCIMMGLRLRVKVELWSISHKATWVPTPSTTYGGPCCPETYSEGLETPNFELRPPDFKSGGCTNQLA